MSVCVTIPKKAFAKNQAVPFESKIKGKIFRGLVVKKGEKYFAYENLCKHLPVTLDLNDGQFLTHDKRQIQCSMHGAVYELDSGLCTGGPCEGATLNCLTLREEASRLVILLPHEF